MNEIPSQAKKTIQIWLYTGMIMIIIMIMIGGITRLTHSGLSMVDWKPIMGSTPPITESDWQESFEKYKAFPEYQIRNFDFSLPVRLFFLDLTLSNRPGENQRIYFSVFSSVNVGICAKTTTCFTERSKSYPSVFTWR